MKTYKKMFLPVIAVAALLFVSCEQEIAQLPPHVTVNTTAINAPAAASTQNLTLSSNMGWMITSAQNSDWLTITQTSGDGSAIVPVNIQTNRTTAVRRDTILFVSETGAEIIRRVPVAQAGATLAVGSTFRHLDGDTIIEDAIGVMTTVSWTAEIVDAASHDWLKITAGSSGDGTGVIELELAENDSFVRRHAFITVTTTEITVAPQTILVVQRGGKNYLDDDPSVAVMIGNVKWATRNLDAFGAFADDAADAGGHFDLVNKNPTPAIAAWNILNNPCPCDWRLPTVAEMNALLTPDAYRRVHYWGSAPAGAWFGPGARNATFATPGSALFLPATFTSDTEGIYWTSGGQALIFNHEDVAVRVQPAANALSVRCVTDRRIEE